MPFQCHSLAAHRHKWHLRSPCWQALLALPDAGWGRLPGRGCQWGYQAGIWSQPVPELAPQAQDKEGPSGWKPGEGGVVVQAEDPKGPRSWWDEPQPRSEAGPAKAAFPA